MRYFELNFTVQLGVDTHCTKSQAFIGRLIRKLSGIAVEHGSNRISNYCFNNFFPIEKDKVYKAGKLYIFRLRSPDLDWIKTIRENALHYKSSELRIENVNYKTVNQYHVTELVSVTPVVIVLNQTANKEEGLPKYLNARFAKNDEVKDNLKAQKSLLDLKTYELRLVSNLQKKYNASCKEAPISLGEDFSMLTAMEINNQKPVVIVYEKDGKEIKFLGNKFKLIFNDDELSQRLAWTALSCGLGEKNALVGAGFCVGKS